MAYLGSYTKISSKTQLGIFENQYTSSKMTAKYLSWSVIHEMKLINDLRNGIVSYFWSVWFSGEVG